MTIYLYICIFSYLCFSTVLSNNYSTCSNKIILYIYICKKIFVESFFFNKQHDDFLLSLMWPLGQQLKVNNLNCEQTVRQAINERRSSSLFAPTLRQHKVNSRLNSIIQYSQLSACERCCMKMWEWEPPEYHATFWSVQPNVVQVTAHSLLRLHLRSKSLLVQSALFWSFRVLCWYCRMLIKFYTG